MARWRGGGGCARGGVDRTDRMAARCRVGAIASRSILASGNGCARFRETRALGFGVQTRGPNVGVPVCPHASSSGSNRPSMAGRDVWCSASASEAQSLCPARTRRPTRLASGPGGGVLDKPDTAFPKFDLDKDVRTRKKKPPRYQVLLHNDEVNRRSVVQYPVEPFFLVYSCAPPPTPPPGIFRTGPWSAQLTRPAPSSSRLVTTRKRVRR